MAPTSLCENRVLAAELVAWHVGGFLLTFLVNPHVAGSDSNDSIVLVVEDLAGGKPRKQHDPKCFGLLSQPSHEISKGNCVVSLVMDGLRDDRIGDADFGISTGKSVKLIQGYR